MSLDRDLRYTTAPLHERCVYARLFEARRSIADALSLGRDPLTIAARALGVERDEASAELDRLRAVGLVGDGLTLLAGVRRSRATAAATTESCPADLDAVRAALVAYAGSRRALARELGCSSAALDRFAAGKGTIGAELLASLAARLPTSTANQHCQPNPPTNAASVGGSVGGSVGTTLVGSQLAASLPSGSPLSSLPEAVSSPAFSHEKTKESEDCRIEGVGSGAREATAAVANQPPTETPTTAPLALDAQPAKPRRERRPKPAPAVDPVPAEGTVARRVYEAITTDVALAPITRGPGDLALRLAALCEGTHVDPAAEVISAGAWLTRNPGRWSDGAAGLLRWVKSSADKARALPPPVIGTPRPSAQTDRVDWKGHRVVGAAGLPPGSAWEKTKEQHEAEEDEIYKRAYAATQPKKGAMGR